MNQRMHKLLTSLLHLMIFFSRKQRLLHTIDVHHVNLLHILNILLAHVSLFVNFGDLAGLSRKKLPFNFNENKNVENYSFYYKIFVFYIDNMF